MNLASAWVNLGEQEKATAAYRSFVERYSEEDELKRKVRRQLNLLEGEAR